LILFSRGADAPINDGCRGRRFIKWDRAPIYAGRTALVGLKCWNKMIPSCREILSFR
jgi:hypothetical protein